MQDRQGEGRVCGRRLTKTGTHEWDATVEHLGQPRVYQRELRTREAKRKRKIKQGKKVFTYHVLC